MQEDHEFQANLGNTARSCPGTNDECSQVVGGEYAFAQILNLPFHMGELGHVFSAPEAPVFPFV